MKTRWEDLVMVNYEVDREWVERFVPAGCELELFEGRALVSVVAFRFRKTKLAGIPMPLYRDFGEINLRIYVKRKNALDGGERRGVVFIREIIKHRLPAWIANVVFRENFSVMPVVYNKTDLGVSYAWGKNEGEGKRAGLVKAEFASGLEEWERGSEEEFIGDNFWAYKDRGRGRTFEFEVKHRAWKMRALKNVVVNIDVEKLYGEDWARMMTAVPRSVFYVDGSAVGVTLPRGLE